MKKIILTAILFTLLFSAKLQSQNIYNADGVLSGNRTLTMGTNSLTFSNNGSPLSMGNSIKMSGFTLMSATGGRYTDRGVGLEFALPANTDGSNFWSAARIITVAGTTNTNDATGKMILGTRRMFDKYGVGNQWHFGDDLTIDGSGRVGIGTATPQYLLDVNGGFRTTGVSVFQDDIILKTGTQDLTPFGTYGKRLYFGNQADNGDYIWMARYNLEANRSDLRINIGDDVKRGGDDRFVVGNIAWNAEGLWKDWFVVNNDGKVGIQVSNPQYPLDVNGAIHAKEVIIDTNFPLADYVFRPDYKLMPLHEVEQFVKTNNHLPEIPSAAQVEKNGMNLGEIQNKLLQKIEELTLYVIEQDKKSQRQQDLIESLQKRLENVEK